MEVREQFKKVSSFLSPFESRDQVVRLGGRSLYPLVVSLAPSLCLNSIFSQYLEHEERVNTTRDRSLKTN